MTEKKGFSVVAATRVTQRFSTPGQQRVLLGLAEAVHLVDEEHRLLAAAGQLGAGGVDRRAHLLDAGGDRRDLDEAPVASAG